MRKFKVQIVPLPEPPRTIGDESTIGQRMGAYAQRLQKALDYGGRDGFEFNAQYTLHNYTVLIMSKESL